MSEKPDLLSVILVLRYRGKKKLKRELPDWWGRAGHALLLDLIQQADPERAEQIHDSQSGPPPFTTSTLIGYRRDTGPDRKEEYRVRITGLNSEISLILSEALQPGGALEEGADLQLDYLPFQISRILHPEADQPWVGSASYQSLSAAWLSTQKTPPRELHFSFTSPTLFKSGGKYVPVPTPELVFHSLLLQWNTYAPITFPEDVKRFAAECLSIQRYKLSTRKVHLGGRMTRVGAVGKISYRADHYDRYWLSVLQILGSCALYTGVGKSTALGLGQARMMG
jgi:CRISPR-associated endoribonuclease Cas6